MKRYDCLRAIAPLFGEELVVTNLGAVRHEWQALRPHPGNYHLQNLGLTSSMALGLALALPQRKVIEVPANLAQPHNSDSDFAITHDCSSVHLKDLQPILLVFMLHPRA